MNKKKIMMFEIMSGSTGGGGGADVSGVTATAPDVDEGKIFVDNTGAQVVGTSTYKADYIALRTDIDNLNDTLEPVLLGDGSDTNVYANVSNVTATASDVAQGKVFVNNSGQEVTGAAVDSTADLIKMIERKATSQSMDTINIPNGATQIGEKSFYEYTYLANITIPNTVTSIGKNAFYNCTNLALALSSNSITSVGVGAFYNCRALTSVNLPNATTLHYGYSRYEPAHTFYQCYALTTVDVPLVTYIHDGEFRGCTNLTSINMPSVTKIGYQQSGEGAFAGCTSLALISLPSGLTSINGRAFQNCTSLALTSLPSGLTYIGDQAFQNCTSLSLTSLPSTVKTISSNAFSSCTGLTTITFEGTPTTIVNTAFQGCTNLTTINVPWSEGAVSGAPWGATNATIVYNYTPS